MRTQALVSGTRRSIYLAFVILLPQILLISMLVSSDVRRSLKPRAGIAATYILGIISVIYWCLLFWLPGSVAGGLIAATAGSFGLVLFYYGIWDDERLQRKSDLKYVYLIGPNLFLGVALTIAEPFTQSQASRMCSLVGLFAVITSTVIAIILLYLSSVLREIRLITNLPFPVPRRNYPYLGAFGVVTYLFWEIAATQDTWLMTDWKILRCLAHHFS